MSVVTDSHPHPEIKKKTLGEVASLVSLKWPKMLGFVPLEKETRSISVQKRHGGDLQGTGDADEKIEVVATGCELGHHHPLKEQFTVDE